MCGTQVSLGSHTRPRNLTEFTSGIRLLWRYIFGCRKGASLYKLHHYLFGCREWEAIHHCPVCNAIDWFLQYSLDLVEVVVRICYLNIVHKNWRLNLSWYHPTQRVDGLAMNNSKDGNTYGWALKHSRFLSSYSWVVLLQFHLEQATFKDLVNEHRHSSS